MAETLVLTFFYDVTAEISAGIFAAFIPGAQLACRSAGCMAAAVCLLFYENRSVSLSFAKADRNTCGKRHVLCLPAAALFGVAFQTAAFFLLGQFFKTGNAEAVYDMAAESGAVTRAVCLGLLIPFAEELCFRGCVYKRLCFFMGFSGASLCSAIIFGVSHLDIPQGIYAGILGIFLAAAYEYGGFFSAFSMHAAANFTALFLAGLF